MSNTESDGAESRGHGHQDELVLTCVDCSFHSDDARKLRRHAKRKGHFTGQKPRREAEKTSWRKRIAVAVRQLLASPHDPPHYNSEPIGEQPDTIRPAKDAYIEQEDVEWLVSMFKGPGETTAHVETVELDTNYGTFEFVAEDGHIKIRYDEEDSNGE